ncbi:MAG: hypothetical protein JRC90_10370 [Deltaproteobacteria bacterium]|nr:hypothetical protein [Deltaproteobacteria bacterium]
MNTHPDPDVMASIPVRWDLQRFPLKAHAVVSSHCSLVMFAQDVVKV